MALGSLAACGGNGNTETNSVTELIRQDDRVGTGAEAQSGRVVVVHYTGWLYDASRPDRKGAKFDSSRDRNEPFSFNLGAGEVIPGLGRGRGRHEGRRPPHARPFRPRWATARAAPAA